MKKLPDKQRLFNNCIRKGECLIFQGALSTRGYGQFKLNGVNIGAHRASYILTKGTIPDGANVCHTCDTPDCVNPLHFFAGSAKLNNQDMKAKKRNRSPRGSECRRSKLTEENVLEIRKRYQHGETQKNLGFEFGVSRSAIEQITSRRRWTHI